jgi:hypothetical protein
MPRRRLQHSSITTSLVALSILILSTSPRVCSFCVQPTRNHEVASCLRAVPNAITTASPAVVNGVGAAVNEEEPYNSIDHATTSFKNNDNVFTAVAARAALCLLESDRKRDAQQNKEGASPSGATNWIDDASAFALKTALNKVKLKLQMKDRG